MSVETKLYAIIPTTRGSSSFLSIDSVLRQKGFNQVEVIVTGNSTSDPKFCNALKLRYGKSVTILRSKKKLAPGAARNVGLNFLQKNKNYKWVMFLDDDIIIPDNYCHVLRRFLQITNSCAVIGNVMSKINNISTKILDYSNFWWLQKNKDCINRGWMGAGATLIKSTKLERILFTEKFYINEDTGFFDTLSKKTGLPLSTCSSVTAIHDHSRVNLWQLIKYQFANGVGTFIFRDEYALKGKYNPHIFDCLKELKTIFLISFKENRDFLKDKYFLLIGVFASFFIFELAILFQSAKKSFTIIFRIFKKKVVFP